MVGLLDLPPEVREPILLDVVVDTIQEQPAHPPKMSQLHISGYRSLKPGERGRFSWATEGSYCKFLRRHAMPLLHINQRIRGEVIDIVHRKLSQHTDDAKLDIMFHNKTPLPTHHMLWATWLSEPFPAYNLNTLTAQIRFFQILGRGTLVHQIPLEDCRLWVGGHVADKLLGLLAALLQKQGGNASIYGRRGATTNRGHQPSYRTIHKLVIEIPIDPNVRNSCEGRVRCKACVRPSNAIPSVGDHRMVPSGKRAALIFATSLHEKLVRILHNLSTSQCDNNALRMIFERVGTITLNVHGLLFGSFNLGEILSQTPRSEQWCGVDLRRSGFFEWKRAAENKRKETGFETFHPSVQEHYLAGSAGLIGSILAARDDSLLGDVVVRSDDNAAPTSQPSGGEKVAFTGACVFFEEDGSKVSGDATFYRPANSHWRRNNHVSKDLEPYAVTTPNSRSAYPDYFEDVFVENPLGERPRKGERVLFEGEAIVFPAQPRETIVSGEAIFYGRAEEAGTEQPPVSRGSSVSLVSEFR